MHPKLARPPLVEAHALGRGDHQAEHVFLQRDLLSNALVHGRNLGRWSALDRRAPDADGLTSRLALLEERLAEELPGRP